MSIDVLWDLSIVEHAKLIQRIEAEPVLEERNKLWDGRCHVLRYILEPYIYGHLSETYGPKLTEFWKTYVPPKKSRWAYVIVERRAHPNFWFILRNIAWAAPQMSVYIFCGDENEGFIRTLLGDKAEYYTIIRAFTGNPAREVAIQDYNNFYTDYRNYDRIDAEYILTVQMDIFIRRKLEMAMFQTDYYGSPWAWKRDDPGGGGATVRRVAKMQEICRAYRPDPSIPCPIPEDGWVNEKIKESGGIWPDLQLRALVLMETVLVPNPYIVHQTWSFTDAIIPDGRDKFLELWRILLTIQIE